MSTKIYDGQRIDKPIGAVYPLALAAVTAMRGLQQDLFNQLVATTAAHLLDRVDLGLRIPDEPMAHWAESLPNATAGRVARSLWAGKRKEAVSDLDFSLCLFPQGRHTLAILYAGDKRLRTPWDTTPGVRAWGYWNNTDREDGVTAREWQARRRAWDRALPGAGVPAHTALTMTGDPQVDHYPANVDVAQAMPPLTERARSLAVDEAAKEWQTANPDATDTDTFRHVWRLTSHVGAADLQPRVDAMTARLRPQITADDLAAPLPHPRALPCK